MSNNLSPNPGNPISSSELVLLRGDQFAKKVMIGNIKLLHTDASVSISQLGQAILAAAVLAAEAAGNLQLEVRQGKAMFGLRKVKNLYANPTPTPVEWPKYSLEAQLPPIAERFKNDQDSHEVSDLIYAWLRQDSSSPWQSAIEMVQSGLAERGLLDTSEETKLKVFTKINYSLPESTASMAAEQPIEPVKQLLANCENDRREIWDLLVKQIKSAIKARTEQDDSVDFD
ncbi:MAG: hypothetical protein ABUK20_13720 [Anaerolineales bacterium]